MTLIQINSRFSSTIVALAISLPVLSPFTGGPNPQAVPLMMGALSIALLLAAYDHSHFKVVVAAWIAVGVLSALLGLLQYFDVAEFFAPWVSPAGAGEAYGNLRQRNQLASMISIGMAAGVWWWIRLKASAPPLHTDRVRPAAACLLAILVVAQAATGSRTGLLQLVVVGLLAFAWLPDQRRRTLRVGLCALGLYVVAAVSLPWLLERLTGVEAPSVFTRVLQPPSCESRLVLWANVVELIGTEPLTGWGWGALDYAHYATLYDGERFCGILDNAHNLPLHLVVELGLPVAVLVCTSVFTLVLRAAPWREGDPVRQLAWAVLTVIALHSLVEYPLWYAPFFTAAGLCVASLAAPRRGAQGGWQPRWPTAVRWVLAAALAATVLHAWHDYGLVSQLYVPAERRTESMRQDPERELGGLVWFRDTRDFAYLTTRPLTRANAGATAATAARLLHYSPEPRVIELLIESLMLHGREEEALWHLTRFRAAFPSDSEAWIHRNERNGRSAPGSTGGSVGAEAP